MPLSPEVDYGSPVEGPESVLRIRNLKPRIAGGEDTWRACREDEGPR
jgi:hypothetical protein